MLLAGVPVSLLDLQTETPPVRSPVASDSEFSAGRQATGTQRISAAPAKDEMPICKWKLVRRKRPDHSFARHKVVT